jgi:hypothetical protein
MSSGKAVGGGTAGNWCRFGVGAEGVGEGGGAGVVGRYEKEQSTPYWTDRERIQGNRMSLGSGQSKCGGACSARLVKSRAALSDLQQARRQGHGLQDEGWPRVR